MDSLRSSEWWKSHGLDVVVLYAWGDPRYQDIARAIREAGILLVQNLDSAGIESPYADIRNWWVSLTDMIQGPQPLSSKARLVARMVRDLFPFIYESRRLTMLEESDVLAVVSPAAGVSISDYAGALGRKHLASRIRVIPHAVPEIMRYDGRSKSKTVICVGRWNKEDWHQKNPQRTLDVARRFCDAHPDWSFEIIGRGADRLSAHFPCASEPSNLRFTPHLERDVLRERYLDSHLIFCASRFESYHIASAEAVCCGCRVVVPDHPLLSSTAWFTTHDSGTVAKSHDAEELLAALNREVACFAPHSTTCASRASHWASLLTGSAVAKTVLDIARALHP